MKIAYMLDYFPALSETFILREILEMKKHLDVAVFARINSLNHKVFSEVVHDDSKELMKEVHYLRGLLKDTKLKRWSSLILLHSYFLLRNPVRYMQTFLYSLRKGNRIFNYFIFSVFCARKLITERCERIHVHYALDACTHTMLISMLSGIPYSFTVHAHDIFIPRLYDLIEDKFNNAKFVVCISEYNRQYVLKHFPVVNPGKIKIVHCGLNLSIFTPGIKEVNKQLTVLSIGRLVEHKGFKYLIEACKLLKEHGNLNFICNIVGGGEDRQILEELISGFNLNKTVNLLGSMEQKDVGNALKFSDLFVLPCVIEKNGMMDGIPVVLMEAMAMKIPVISTRVSGIPELVKDGAGILVEPQDVKGLALAIEKILRLPNDEKEAMGRRGRTIVEEDFNLEKEVKKLAELVGN
jgi:colanic acid/amylovoran biosynthesis glycosyltransferase